MAKLALIALAGGIGTLARYGLTLGLTRAFGDRFPLGTFVVNLLERGLKESELKQMMIHNPQGLLGLQ